MSVSDTAENEGPVPLLKSRDLWLGLAIMAIALLALWASDDIPGRGEAAFGPATAPFLFACVLLVLGFLILLGGVVRRQAAVPRYSIRGPVFVTAAGILFAAAIGPLGLALSIFLTFLIACMASSETRVMESIVFGLLMSALCCGLFVYGLRLPVNIWPSF